jgi:hypothetical protein
VAWRDHDAPFGAATGCGGESAHGPMTLKSSRHLPSDSGQRPPYFQDRFPRRYRCIQGFATPVLPVLFAGPTALHCQLRPLPSHLESYLHPARNAPIFMFSADRSSRSSSARLLFDKTLPQNQDRTLKRSTIGFGSWYPQLRFRRQPPVTEQIPAA